MLILNSITMAVAINTLRGFSRDKVFHATLVFAVLLVSFSYGFSTLSLVESTKILLDFGLTAISLCGILISIALGVGALSREIESKIVYTMISKPISRVEYLLGKYLGCAMVVILVHLIMSFTLSLLLWAEASSFPDGMWACLYLMTLESLIILAAGIFASIFSSSILAASFTMGIFLIGRSSYFFKHAMEQANDGFSRWMFRFLYDVLPNLDRFNIRELTAYSKPYPPNLLPWSTLYCLGYAALFLIFSSILFRRRDLP